MSASVDERGRDQQQPISEDAITVSGLRKRYGTTTAVADVSFAVGRGEIFGLIGPNGSGKTTTVECVQGLRAPDAGTVRVLGLDPASDRTELRRRIGCQLQESALPDRIKVWEALDLQASLSPQSEAWQPLLDEWGLGEKRNSTFASLSGGQRQRLFVALALVNRPEIVFLDEMTTGLDPAARRVAWRLIERLRSRGTTVVLVTHFMDEADRLCDRLAVLVGGRIVAVGTPHRLIADHAQETRVSFTAGGNDLSWLERLPSVERVQSRGTRIEVTGGNELLLHLGAALLERGIEPADLRVQQGNLEDAFLALTGEEPQT